MNEMRNDVVLSEMHCGTFPQAPGIKLYVIKITLVNKIRTKTFDFFLFNNSFT